jgi:hypothetical protein
MAKRADAYGSLREMLRLTRDEELDCDRFLELSAPFLDGRVDDPCLLALIEHHRQLCTRPGPTPGASPAWSTGIER